MEVFDAVRTVLAVREYQDKPIPSDTIQRIVAAAHLTASSQNKQPWHFIVIEDRDTLRELGSQARSGPYIAQAAFAIVVVMDKVASAVSDGSRAIQSMVLTAWSEGVGSNWVGLRTPEAVKSLLEIPEELDILAIVPFGYPARPIGLGKKKRKPLAEVAFRGKFGQPFV
jgi:nitroreductase